MHSGNYVEINLRNCPFSTYTGVATNTNNYVRRPHVYERNGVEPTNTTDIASVLANTDKTCTLDPLPTKQLKDNIDLSYRHMHYKRLSSECSYAWAA